MLNLGRRALLGGAIAGAGGLLWRLPGRAAGGEPLHFQAFRDGDPIGRHRVTFTEQDQRLILEIEISFTVTFALIPVYRYRHRNREVWTEGGCCGSTAGPTTTATGNG